MENMFMRHLNQFNVIARCNAETVNISDSAIDDFANGEQDGWGDTLADANSPVGAALNILASGNKFYTNDNASLGDDNGVFVKFDLYTTSASSGTTTISFGNRSIDLNTGEYVSGETYREKSDGVYSQDDMYAEVNTTNSSGGYLEHSVEIWMPSYWQATSEFVVTDNTSDSNLYMDNVDVDYTSTAEFFDVNDNWLVDVGDAQTQAGNIDINPASLTASGLSSGWQFMSNEMFQLGEDLEELNREISGRVFQGEGELSDAEMRDFVNQISNSLDSWNSSSGAPGLDQRSDAMWRLVHTDSANAFDTARTTFDNIVLASTALFAVSAGFTAAAAASSIAAASAVAGGAGSAGFLTSAIVGVAANDVSDMTSLPSLDLDDQMGLDTFLFIEQEITDRVMQGGDTQGLATARGNFIATVDEAYSELEDFVANVSLINLLSQQGVGSLSASTIDTIEDLGFTVGNENQQTGTNIYRQEITSGESELQADAVRWVFKDKVWGTDTVRIEVNPLGPEGWL